ncbi:MAG TPA: hypothetical protein PK089_09125 [Methanoregulaceae archaeon]|nr:hypothetical protein [Methanoregulaceae archaeon]HQJ88353.1 hypothetical protein [Methanoregulaceae archaeon]
MRKETEIEGTRIVLDTDVDILLFAAPRPVDHDTSAYVRGRDLYLHEHGEEGKYFYIHQWSLVPGEDESLALLPNRQAERFLGERGLECDEIPGTKAYAALRTWGYGIAEEF